MKRTFIFLGAVLSLSCLRADEGLWLYNRFPKEQVRAKYGFEVTHAFLNHLRLSSLRMAASASFVSPSGLIFTNHHVASGCIQKVSTAEHNYMADGFYAPTEAEEIPCPGLEADQLLSILDVTGQVNSLIQAPLGTPEANRQRRASIAAVEKSCSERTGHKCQVVALYSGAIYDLYEYKPYTDIRLVFAPQKAVAFFGGNTDNFTYPRYDLDIAFMRAYENGRPAKTPEYLKWSKEGVKDGELAFVSGNPASTDRFITVAEWDYLRDTEYPLALAYLRSAIGALRTYGARSPENRRVAEEKLFMADNSDKARTWEYEGLRDPKLIQIKKEREQKLRAAIDKNPKVRNEVGPAWLEIATAWREWAPYEKSYWILERGPLFSDLFRIARTTLRLPEEKAKPNGDRLREFTDANLPEVERRLYSPAPITPSLEIAVLTNYFEFMRRELGAGDPVLKAVLAGRTPAEAAARYVSTSSLADIAVRKRLAGDLKAVQSSKDGMIELARILDGPARQVRKRYESLIDTVRDTAGARIARARFDVYGPTEYPDATFTLRLSFGAVKGYRNEKNQPVPFDTDFAGMYRHATGKDDFRLPESVLKAKSALDLATPLNFVSTCDIIGGNSGSPTVNTRGEIVGIIFDSNLEALPNRFIYEDVRGRAVHVAGQGIIEALRHVYHANRLLTELGFGK
jgi:hypothetical protein